MPDQVLDLGPIKRPTAFARSYAGWVAWLAEPEDDGFDWAATFDAARAGRATFRLTASDRPLTAAMAALEDSAFADEPDEGELSRQDREFAAFITSRTNGCLNCTSIHALHFGRISGDRALTQGILDSADQAEIPARERVLLEAAAALTATPPRFGPAEVQALTDQGLDLGAILDFIHVVAYFSYANRLVLTVGEPITK
jgi:uncharacterized peroxidase-related enzyme